MGPASKLQFQLPPLVSCSSLQVESKSYHLQAPSNLESLCELPEDVFFILSPGMAGTSQQVFCAVDSEFLPDQDAAQPSLRLLFAQSLACGKESINIWNWNKLNWALTVAGNFNCSPLLGGDFAASLWSQDHAAANGAGEDLVCVLSDLAHPYSPQALLQFSLLLLMEADGD